MSKTAAFVFVGLFGAMLAGMVAFNFLVPPPVAPVHKTPPLAIIGTIVGQVELMPKGSKRFLPAKVGAALAEGDQVRTGLFSEAMLFLRGSSSVVISPNSVFEVGTDRVQHSSFALGEGRIVAAIPRESDREFQFLSRGSEAVTSSRQGEFSLATDGKGTVVVDTRKGSVKIKAKGTEVAVPKGKRSIVLPDQPPSKVLPIPTSVALQVRWPPLKTDRVRAQVSGKTSAAATVLINGILVRADDQGGFSADVPLVEGNNRLVVTTTDLSGNSAIRQSPEIRVDTRPPDVKVDAQGLWK